LPDLYYFAEEGSWGSLENGIVADVTLWTAQDFEEVDNCSDSERTFVVRGIVDKYGKFGGIL
jgi:predicted amidohydrolase YtcJ